MAWLTNHIRFKFNNRLTRIWGRAWQPNNLIELSTLLWLAGSEQDKKDTIIHEACHIIVWHKYGNTPDIKHHGKEWKMCMTLSGVEPDVTGRVRIKV